MKRDNKLRKNRIDFVKLSINDPKKGEKKLKELAEGLGNCKTTKDIFIALTQILGVSEKTIMRDFLNDDL